MKNIALANNLYLLKAHKYQSFWTVQPKTNSSDYAVLCNMRSHEDLNPNLWVLMSDPLTTISDHLTQTRHLKSYKPFHHTNIQSDSYWRFLSNRTSYINKPSYACKWFYVYGCYLTLTEDITLADYQTLIDHLALTDHLTLTEDNQLKLADYFTLTDDLSLTEHLTLTEHLN